MDSLEMFGATPVQASDDSKTKIETIQKSLVEREKKFQAKEDELEKKQREILEKERILNVQIERYEKTIRELQTKTSELDRIKDERADSLRQVYERMDPKKAAKIIDDMDLGLATQILGGMRNDKAAEILQRMNAERARLVSERFAGKRNLASSKSLKVNEVTGSKEPQNGEGGLTPAPVSKGGE